MIENYRSQLLWNNFMANTEIQQALDDIGFTEDLTTSDSDINTDIELVAMPNPMLQRGLIEFNLKQPRNVSLYLKDLSEGHYRSWQTIFITQKENTRSHWITPT